MSSTDIEISNSIVTLPIRDLTKIFEKIADNEVLLNVTGAGTPELSLCCHGGCDNCAVSHIFDYLSSARAKWVALYPTMKFIDDRSHVARWAWIFTDLEVNMIDKMTVSMIDETKRIDKNNFIDRLIQIPRRLSIGPSVTVPSDEPLEKDILSSFYDKITRSDKLNALEFSESLKFLCKEEHASTWLPFSKAFT